MPALQPHQDIKAAYMAPAPAKRTAAKPSKKIAPACMAKDEDKRLPHNPIPWGSDPHFATCSHGCGTTFRRKAIRHVYNWEIYEPAKPSKADRTIKRNKASGMLAQTTLEDQIAQAALFSA